MCVLTGCESIVKDAKPPEQYLDSQVIDGNFIDFSDPGQVYALYEAHYAAQQKDPNYKSYSELRGGLDMFGIPTDWSKNFITFDVVHYDEDRGNLIYALMTTNLSKADSEYEYIADAQVKISEDGKITVVEDIEQNVEEDPFLIAAVGFYNYEKDSNKFFFIDKDYAATRDDAGNGAYNLVVKQEGDTVAVLYKEEVLFYCYDTDQKTYVLDDSISYNMKDIYDSTSFSSSARDNGLEAISENQISMNVELRYKAVETGDTVMTLDDQQRIQAYMTELNQNNEAMADAFLAMFYKNYDPDMLEELLDSLNSWTSLTPNNGEKRSMDDFLACVNGVSIPNATVTFDEFATKKLLSTSTGTGIGITGAMSIADVSPYKYARLFTTEDAYLFVPFTMTVTFSGNPDRTYKLNCEFYFLAGSGFFTTNVDWGDAEFTIHDIRFKNQGNGKMIPDWIQVEYSKNTETTDEPVSSSNLMDRLQALESSAQDNLSQGSKWLDVSLSLASLGKSYKILISSQVEIGSLNAITEIMETERERVKAEIGANVEKYRYYDDVTKGITADHIADLNEMISIVVEAELEEARALLDRINPDSGFGLESPLDSVIADIERKARLSSLSARFCQEDGSDSDTEVIMDSGQALLDCFVQIYNCQEKIKQQEVYLDACEYLKVNDVYDQMLTVMESKLNDYAVSAGLSDEKKQALSDAITRQMINRGLKGSASSKEMSVDEWMLPASLVGDVTDDASWETLKTATMEDAEESDLLAYLVENQTGIFSKLNQTVTDLETLKSMALTVYPLVEGSSSLLQESETAATENTDDFYTVGYENMLNAYQRGLDALTAITEGAEHIDTYRENLKELEDEDISICRFDAEISEERKEKLLEECDRMEALLKTIYTGSSDSDRNAAMEELESTQWHIDVDWKVIEGKIYCIQEESQSRTYYETVWTATVEKITDSHNAYQFSKETSSLYFDEGEGKVLLMEDAPPEFSVVESEICEFFTSGFYNKSETFCDETFFQDMDQAVVASVQYGNENKSLYGNLPNNRCQIILLSQAEGRSAEDGTADPKWSFMALPYSKLGLEQVDNLTAMMNTVGAAASADDLKPYGYIAKMGINNEMTDSEMTDTEDSYETKIRGMLRDGSTIFLDNPKLDWTSPEKSRFYFLNISLDEGIQLYALKPDTGTLERQNTFTETALVSYVDGSWFKGWWIPDAGTNYNDQGKLGGGKLVLLGLTSEDMKTYSSETDGSIRELVADDIYHSKLYEVNISSSQMNACKK